MEEFSFGWSSILYCNVTPHKSQKLSFATLQHSFFKVKKYVIIITSKYNTHWLLYLAFWPEFNISSTWYIKGKCAYQLLEHTNFPLCQFLPIKIIIKATGV